MDAKQLLADIRNKMTPASHLISLVERYFDTSLSSVEEFTKLHNAIKTAIPKAKESIEYLRNNNNFKGKL